VFQLKKKINIKTRVHVCVCVCVCVRTRVCMCGLSFFLPSNLILLSLSICVICIMSVEKTSSVLITNMTLELPLVMCNVLIAVTVFVHSILYV
jgi:hypothetical protein